MESSKTPGVAIGAEVGRRGASNTGHIIVVVDDLMMKAGIPGVYSIRLMCRLWGLFLRLQP